MRADDDSKSGIPTRAIHEAYLDMHRALKRYRQAKDKGTAAERDAAHGDVQEAVLTFYEMLRPHIKQDNSVQGYWAGELPSYPHKNGDVPDPEDGKGVLQVQTHHEVMAVPEGLNPSGMDRLKDWHDVLGLNGQVRLRGVYEGEGGGLVVSVDKYQLGLRQLDQWGTEYTTTQATIGGFLGGTTEQKSERVRVDVAKLKRAARELSDVAKELGFLPQSEIADNDDALPI